MPKRYWARLRAELDCPLRRGAWYQVRRLRPPEVIVDVLGERVIVPRSALEIASTPPLRWSVVHRHQDAWLSGASEYCSTRSTNKPVSVTHLMTTPLTSQLGHQVISPIRRTGHAVNWAMCAWRPMTTSRSASRRPVAHSEPRLEITRRRFSA